MHRKTESLIVPPTSKVRDESSFVNRMSESLITNEVEIPHRDIDEEDKDDPFFMTEYVKDIYKILREEEEETKIPDNFMNGHLYMKTQMRQKLVDWIAEISKTLGLLTETYLLSIYILDKYLSVNKKIQRDRFQLVGVASVLLASKFEEYSYVIISDLVALTGDAYTPEMIKEMECEMINSLKFKIIRPTSLDFLRRFSRAANNDEIPHKCSRYLIELATMDHVLMEMKPSCLAAASIYLGRRICDIQPYWDQTLIYYTGYTEEEVKEWARLLRLVHTFFSSSKVRLKNIKLKYATKHNKEVSLLPPVDEF
ncbi:Cyclin [Entamoeba marina]